MSRPPIYSAKPCFSDEDITFILSEVPAILRGQLTMGRWVRQLEELATQMAGTRYAVATNSCTAALEIGLKSMGIGPDDEVIVPVQTFVATANAVRNVGARPVFADIDAGTHCISPESLERNITSLTRAVIVVHYGGLITPHIDDLLALCEQHKLKLLEDAAHAHGAAKGERAAGSIGHAGAFSYYATKVLTSGGEGGMLTTNDETIYNLARIYQARGQDPKVIDEEIFILPGHNVRMTEFAALCGVTQHWHLKEFLERRRQIAHIYAEHLDSYLPEIEFQRCPPDTRHAYWKFTVNLPAYISRREFQALMKDKCNISVNWSYFPPIHLQPVFKDLYGTYEGQCPVAEDVCARCLNLPMYSMLTSSDAEYVCGALKSVYHELAQTT